MKKTDVTVFVCRTCDRDKAKWETPEAEGVGFLGQVRRLLRGDASVKVRAVACLGGCECNGTPNGCCSVGLAGKGRFGYVLNQFDPAQDGWKVLEFLRLYRLKPNGRIVCRDSDHYDQLTGHVATRVPPARD